MPHIVQTDMEEEGRARVPGDEESFGNVFTATPVMWIPQEIHEEKVEFSTRGQ